MLSPAEATELILQRVSSLGFVPVELDDSVGYVVASDLVATEAVPPFDNSAMDGFAVRAADLKGANDAAPVSLLLQDTLRAGGSASLTLQAGHAIKIMTGAPLPQGADAVAIKEVSLPVQNGHVDIVHEPEAGGDVAEARPEQEAQHHVVGPRQEDPHGGIDLLVDCRRQMP